ncbi:MAG: hypothetical protein [Microvirus sp.]|nr:MAG: hypothetical protein [Microvirus sp.]
MAYLQRDVYILIASSAVASYFIHKPLFYRSERSIISRS